MPHPGLRARARARAHQGLPEVPGEQAVDDEVHRRVKGYENIPYQGRVASVHLQIR